jgi:hypothetical protein
MPQSMIRASLLGLVTLIGTSSAFAGPPLLCHPFEIGSARSLPWNDGAQWWNGRADYNVQNLVADTETLLTPSTPVIVRMETLRRAAIYASRDTRVAAQLLSALQSRVQRTVGTNPDALAFFDAGYLAETYRQIVVLENEREFRDAARALRGTIGDNDGYALVKKSLTLRPDDAAMEFAAALIARGTRHADYATHAAKARRGATADALLAKNLKQLS